MLNKNDFEDWAEWVNNEGMIINTSVVGRLMESKVAGGSVSLVGDAEYDIELKVSNYNIINIKRSWNNCYTLY